MRTNPFEKTSPPTTASSQEAPRSAASAAKEIPLGHVDEFIEAEKVSLSSISSQTDLEQQLAKTRQTVDSLEELFDNMQEFGWVNKAEAWKLTPERKQLIAVKENLERLVTMAGEQNSNMREVNLKTSQLNEEVTSLHRFLHEKQSEGIRETLTFGHEDIAALVRSNQVLKHIFENDLESALWYIQANSKSVKETRKFSNTQLLGHLNTRLLEKLHELGVLKRMASAEHLKLQAEAVMSPNLPAEIQLVEAEIAKQPSLASIEDIEAREAHWYQLRTKEDVLERMLAKSSQARVVREELKDAYYREGFFYRIPSAGYKKVRNISKSVHVLCHHGDPFQRIKESLIKKMDPRQVEILKRLGLIESYPLKDVAKLSRNDGHVKEKNAYLVISNESMGRLSAALLS